MTGDLAPRSAEDLAVVLKAMNARQFENRIAIRKIKVLMRLWPEGLVLEAECAPWNHDAGRHVKLCETQQRTIAWEDLPALTLGRARELADEVCRPAAAALGVTL